MKINDLYASSQAAAAYQSQTQRTQQTDAASTAQSGKVSGTSGSSGSDAVDLSTLAGTLQAALTDSPEHLAKLEKLTQLYASGQYHVDAHKIAGSLVDETILGSAE